MSQKYEIQIHLNSGEIIDSRNDKDLLLRPWGSGDTCEPFQIFQRYLNPGETAEINVLGKIVSFTSPEN